MKYNIVSNITMPKDNKKTKIVNVRQHPRSVPISKKNPDGITKDKSKAATVQMNNFKDKYAKIKK